MIIAVDVDGTVADLYAEWLKRYNRDFNDNLTVDKLLTWHITEHVKPEAKKKIFEYLSDIDLYEYVPVIEGALEGVQALRNAGHRVVFVSSCVIWSADQKWLWLERHQFLPAGRYYHDDLLICHDKTLVKADVLVDDGLHNVEKWGYQGVLFGEYPHNSSAGPKITRARTWKDVTAIFGL